MSDTIVSHLTLDIMVIVCVSLKAKVWLRQEMLSDERIEDGHNNKIRPFRLIKSVIISACCKGNF